jgi:hypothetical protein
MSDLIRTWPGLGQRRADIKPRIYASDLRCVRLTGACLTCNAHFVILTSDLQTDLFCRDVGGGRARFRGASRLSNTLKVIVWGLTLAGLD